MKKYLRILLAFLLIVIALLATFTAVAATQTGFFEEIKMAGGGFISNGIIDRIIDENKANINERIVYDIDDFQLLHITPNGDIVQGFSSSAHSLYAVNNYWPITNLQKINESLIYTVYNVRMDDGEECSMYVFFSPLDPTKNCAPENTEQWWITGRVFFMCKTLSYIDFSTIELGDSFEEVVNIDPVATIQRPNDPPAVETAEVFDFEKNCYVEKTREIAPMLKFKTYHYLTDGILCITFSRTSRDATFYVSEINFNDSFEVYGTDGVSTICISKEDYSS